MIKIHYGESYFPNMVRKGYYYVDRTPYIEILENLGERYLLFLRPRRFGKSLFLSMLWHYYGIEHKNDFQELFGKYHVGQNPTPLANNYLVLRMQFSGISTETHELALRDFLREVRKGIDQFFRAYEQWLGMPDEQKINNFTHPAQLLSYVLDTVHAKAFDKKIYVLIDEYDHFANELLAFDFEGFMEIVGATGFVRKFYEILKDGTALGIVDRIFITGILPITLDSLTSGFNIAKNFSSNRLLNEMMGFVEEEVITLLEKINIEKQELPSLLTNLRQWYDGYLFHKKGKAQIYNPEMVLFFITEYLSQQEYPENLLPENITSDYSKVRNLFNINNQESINLSILETIIEERQIKASLVRQYSFKDQWEEKHFLSLLFYMGILTIEGSHLDKLIMKMPNFVIRQLYFQYFHQLKLEKANLNAGQIRVADKIEKLAEKNNIEPLLQLTENILSQLAVEDRAHFNELQVKAIFTAFFYQVGYFNIFSELEVRKSKTKKGRIDLLLTHRPPFQPKYQFVFELKYLKKSQSKQLDKTKNEAIKQLKAYLQHDDFLKNTANLKAYVVVFVVNKGYWIEL